MTFRPTHIACDIKIFFSYVELSFFKCSQCYVMAKKMCVCVCVCSYVTYTYIGHMRFRSTWNRIVSYPHFILASPKSFSFPTVQHVIILRVE